MIHAGTRVDRRTVLRTAAGAVLASAAAHLAVAHEGEQAMSGVVEGKPGDFDFLAGNWKIKHRKLKAAHGIEWDEFEWEATCWTILGGVGSVEELRIPARGFSGMGLRLLDVQNKVWNDFWVNGKSGVLTTPGQTGTFENGVGTFTADDKDGDKPIKVKGVWDRITHTSCRWWQAVSWDDGKTWEENWFMDWTRA
jgi:hypothetical protein